MPRRRAPEPAGLPRIEAVAEIVGAASALARELVQKPLDTHTKSDDSPVTAIDLAVDRLLHGELTRLFPAAAWLSEETADRPERHGATWLWVVDPIDGTRSLVAGRPEFCVSVALVRAPCAGAPRGEPVQGVIDNPMTAERFTAVRGHGAFDADGRRLQAASAASRGPAAPLRLLLSRSDHANGLWDGLLTPAHAWRTMGSLAYKMGLVATGAWDGHATPTARSEWDAAAGLLVLEESGGRASDLRGCPLSFNQAVPVYAGMVVARADAFDAVLALGIAVAAGAGRRPAQG